MRPHQEQEQVKKEEKGLGEERSYEISYYAVWQNGQWVWLGLMHPVIRKQSQH